MKQGLKNIFNTLYNRLILFNNPYYFYGIPNVDYVKRGDSVELKKIGLTVHQKEGDSLIKGYFYAIKIKQALNGKFTLVNGGVFLAIGPLQFRINSAEELFIVYEVFICEDYKYCCLRDTVFVDIGMNAGITTLYYAQQPLVKQIYSFELFRPTFMLGEQNLKLNETFSGKVKAFNYGLSNRSYTTTLDYSLTRKGRMGLKGLPGDEQFSDAVNETVIVKDIAEVFETLIAASGSSDIIVKMDCEGEEYNLIERLSNSGLLGKLTVLIVEWHYIRPTAIENQLKAADFHVFSQTLPTLDSGIIYAGKRNLPL